MDEFWQVRFLPQVIDKQAEEEQKVEQETIAKRLREARMGQGLSTIEAAHELGSSPQTIRNHESGMAFTVGALRAYSQSYNVSLNWLVYGQGKGNRQKRKGKSIFKDVRTVTELLELVWQRYREAKSQETKDAFEVLAEQIEAEHESWRAK